MQEKVTIIDCGQQFLNSLKKEFSQRHLRFGAFFRKIYFKVSYLSVTMAYYITRVGYVALRGNN